MNAIVSVDPFYLKLPETTTSVDGTQDTLLVRVITSDGNEGWGECDASPLVSISVFCCPMSHGNIINIRESLIGEKLLEPNDILRLHEKVLKNGLDIDQIHHAYSGVDIALWDLLGKKLNKPVYQLLSSLNLNKTTESKITVYPKIAYGSSLFGDTPTLTKQIAEKLAKSGFKAVKFGWGQMGKNEELDIELVAYAREGLGNDVLLMIDAGVTWKRDIQVAFNRTVSFSKYDLVWLEEPLLPDAVEEYKELNKLNPSVAIACGENCSNYRAAEDIILNSGCKFIQIDAGRCGGITTAYKIRLLAEKNQKYYVNHTFKSHLSLSAALHVFASNQDYQYLEYSNSESPIAFNISSRILLNSDGTVNVPEEPGLGITMNREEMKKYLVPLEIKIGSDVIFKHATLDV